MTFTTSSDIWRSPANRQLALVKQQYLIDKLDRRLAAARERGDRMLVAQLTIELGDLTASI
jgi:hypothetical protein